MSQSVDYMDKFTKTTKIAILGGFMIDENL